MSAPLTTPDCDLRDFAFMPLDVNRLLTSETWIEAADDPKLGHALVCLWCAAWHQLPAGSLPDNDRVLARFAMCTADEWQRLRDRALEGWQRCSDGRLYHPVVAEKALEAWIEKLGQRKSSAAGNAKRWGVEIATSDVDCRIEIARAMLAGLNPESRTLRKRLPKPGNGNPEPMPLESRRESRPDRKRQGQGQGQGQRQRQVTVGAALPRRPPPLTRIGFGPASTLSAIKVSVVAGACRS